ncbi:MAG: hypothetical protein FWD68_16180 [Alphaproteobacteria bacterium]|nr:hypothetical protein [Alphaproteobacteria bacterium]
MTANATLFWSVVGLTVVALGKTAYSHHETYKKNIFPLLNLICYCALACYVTWFTALFAARSAVSDVIPYTSPANPRAYRILTGAIDSLNYGRVPIFLILGAMVINIVFRVLDLLLFLQKAEPAKEGDHGHDHK